MTLGLRRTFAAETGRELWHTGYAAPYEASPPTAAHGAGPKATPLFHEGKVFTVGISGIVAAFDAGSGTLLWRTAAPSEPPYFSASSSLVGDAGIVIAVVKAGSILFLLNDNAELIVARGSRSAFAPFKTYAIGDSATWAQPAISGQRLFVKDVSSLSLWMLQ